MFAFARCYLVIGMAILLANCATTTRNFSSSDVTSWQGVSSKLLQARFGNPSEKIYLTHAHKLLLYNTKTYSVNQRAHAYHIVVAYRQGMPMLVTQPNLNYPFDRTNTYLTCVALFEIDEAGIIIHTQIEGSGCNGNPWFVAGKSSQINK